MLRPTQVTHRVSSNRTRAPHPARRRLPSMPLGAELSLPGASDSVRRTRNPKSSGPSKGVPVPPPIAIFSTGTRNRGISSGFAKRTSWTALNDDFQYGHEQVHNGHRNGHRTRRLRKVVVSRPIERLYALQSAIQYTLEPP